MADIHFHNVCRSFGQGSSTLKVLNNVTFDIQKGQSVALVGFSGSGKSTLLQILGLLDDASSGDIWLKGQSVNHFSEVQKTLFRRQHLGFIYQFHHLLNEFTSLENVVLPQLIRGVPAQTATKNAMDMIQRLQMHHRVLHRPSQLSGGEQQRIAIARALVSRPSIILADEPTGNLDAATAQTVFQELISHVKEEGNVLIMATHNNDLARKMDRIFLLEEGTIREQTP